METRIENRNLKLCLIIVTNVKKYIQQLAARRCMAALIKFGKDESIYRNNYISELMADIHESKKAQNINNNQDDIQKAYDKGPLLARAVVLRAILCYLNSRDWTPSENEYNIILNTGKYLTMRGKVLADLLKSVQP
jgi:hypothetical protein